MPNQPTQYRCTVCGHEQSTTYLGYLPGGRELDTCEECGAPAEKVGPHLIIVCAGAGTWVVDEDSLYILDKASQGRGAVTLAVSSIKPLPVLTPQEYRRWYHGKFCTTKKEGDNSE